MKHFCKLFLILILFPSFSCGWITGPGSEFQLPPPENLVSMVAVFNERYTPNGAHVEKLVLVDFNNPSNYKIVTNSTMRPEVPKFSQDKTKILFTDLRRFANDEGPQFAVYDITAQEIEFLYHNNDQINPVRGFRFIWDRDNNGFFHSMETFIGNLSLFFHDLSTDISTTLQTAPHILADIYPAVLADSERLIVFSSDSIETQQPEGFYFTDRNGKYLSRIDNPHLMSKTRVNKLTREAFTLDWNEASGLIVYAEHFAVGAINNNRTISVTNLDGSYYKRYTSGSDTDFFPVWGPDGKTILFERKPHFTLSADPKDNRIMILDIETGDVREFVSPGTIGGAIGLRFPDY